MRADLHSSALERLGGPLVASVIGVVTACSCVKLAVSINALGLRDRLAIRSLGEAGLDEVQQDREVVVRDSDLHVFAPVEIGIGMVIETHDVYNCRSWQEHGTHRDAQCDLFRLVKTCIAPADFQVFACRKPCSQLGDTGIQVFGPDCDSRVPAMAQDMYVDRRVIAHGGVWWFQDGRLRWQAGEEHEACHNSQYNAEELFSE